MLIISHRMPDVFAVSDRIAVLRRGKLVANKNANESSPEEVTALITEQNNLKKFPKVIL